MRSARTPRFLAVLTAAALTVTGLVATVAPSVSQAAEGTNVALASNGGVATASGTEVTDGRWPVAAINDGDVSSRWSSNTSDDAWAQIQLSAPTVVDHVTIHWEAGCAARYKLQVSADGTTWTDATAEITPVCDQAITHTLNEATATTASTHVRMQGLDRTPINGTKYGMSLYELEVWDGPVPEPAPSLSLVPLPQELQQLDEAPFVLGPDTRFEATGEAAAVAELLAERFRASTGFALPVVADARTDAVRFVLTDSYAAGRTLAGGGL